MTTIAKRAGITWRKMTPQEKGRFMDRKGYPKGKIPLNIIKHKFQSVSINKVKVKRIRKAKRNHQQREQSKSTSKRKVSK